MIKAFSDGSNFVATITLKTRVRRADNVLTRELDDETIILNLNTEHYLGLDEIRDRFL